MKKALLFLVALLTVSCTSFAQTIVKDMNAGAGNTFFYGLGQLNGKVYFMATGSDNVTSLYQSDGTAVGTAAIRSGFSTFNYGSFDASFITVGNKLLFYARDEQSGEDGLWSTDGTAGGTIFLCTLQPLSIIKHKDNAYIMSYDGLWRSDGTAGGTVKIATPNVNSIPFSMITCGDYFYFQGNTGAGLQLWKSDGTPEGTKMIKDLAPSYPYSNSFTSTAVYNGKLYFTAFNPGVGNTAVGVSDGTEEGTNWTLTGMNGTWLCANSSKLFIFQGGGGEKLYVSDGTDAGTKTITTNIKFYNSDKPIFAGEQLYVLQGVTVNTRQRLYRIDEAYNPVLVKDSIRTNFNVFKAQDNFLLFCARTASLGCELYSSDGTKEGTKLIKDLNPGKNDGVSTGLMVDNTLYFIGTDGKTGSELWKYELSASPVKADPEQTATYHLSQNYPNPFNPVTRISYYIPEDQYITLQVFDVLGKEIATLVNEFKSAGSYDVQFNATDLPSGIYLYRIKAGDYSQTLKMIVLK